MAINRQAAPAWFRIVAVVLLIWGAMGCYACIQQFRLGAAAMGPPSGYDLTLFAALPVWYNPVYAVGVGTGLLGSLALLARSAIARPLYIVSLVAVLIQFGWLFATTDIIAVKGAWTLGFPVFIAAVAVLSIWLASHARRRGWIG